MIPPPMKTASTSSVPDPVLLPYLREADADSERALSRILSEHAEPVISAVIKAKLRVGQSGSDDRRREDAKEIHNEVLLQVLEGLRELKANPESKAISDFRSYVAVIAFHTCYSHLRKQNPQRWRLKNRMRYLLTHHQDFELWQSDEGEWLAGSAGSRDQAHATASRAQLQQISTDARLLVTVGQAGSTTESARLRSLLAEIFKLVERPVELDDLVNLIADSSGIKETSTYSLTADETERVQHEVKDPHVSMDVVVEQRLYLERLWAEIRDLPLRQRVALLLNLRDARGASSVELFLLLGIADIPTIAATLEVGPEEFARLWNELPLEDSRIAERLGLARQQVINLRKAARDRLARRMRNY